jgi:hypothetical protein
MAAVGVMLLVTSSRSSSADDGPGLRPPFPDPEVRSWQIGILRPDRLQHATLGFTAGSLLGLPSRSAEAALIGTVSISLAKELWDSRTGKFDAVDLLASTLGGAAAAAITATIRD